MPSVGAFIGVKDDTKFTVGGTGAVGPEQID